MKLIAKYKDYYDYIARDRNLSDQTYTWQREPKVVKVEFDLPAPVYMSNQRLLRRNGKCVSDSIEAVGFLVFFCGRIIPVVKIVESKVNQIQTIRYAFSIDEIPAELLPQDSKNRKWNSLYHPFSRMDLIFSISAQTWMSTKFEDAVRFDGNAKFNKISINDMHRKLGTPIFCHAAGVPEVLGQDANYGWRAKLHTREPSVIVNPILLSLQINKVLDPFLAFCDIERYLTNELAPKDFKRDLSVVEKEIPDKLKVQSHGFDKHSFRKEPSKRK